MYGPFYDRGEWRIRWNKELYNIYYDIDVVKRIKLSLVWTAPAQFVKSLNLSQVVEVVEKDHLASVGSTR